MGRGILSRYLRGRWEGLKQTALSRHCLIMSIPSVGTVGWGARYVHSFGTSSALLRSSVRLCSLTEAINFRLILYVSIDFSVNKVNVPISAHFVFFLSL